MGLHLEEGKEHGFFSAGTERETDLNIEGPTNTAWIGFEETNTVQQKIEDEDGELEEMDLPKKSGLVRFSSCEV